MDFEYNINDILLDAEIAPEKDLFPAIRKRLLFRKALRAGACAISAAACLLAALILWPGQAKQDTVYQRAVNIAQATENLLPSPRIESPLALFEARNIAEDEISLDRPEELISEALIEEKNKEKIKNNQEGETNISYYDIYESENFIEGDDIEKMHLHRGLSLDIFSSMSGNNMSAGARAPKKMASIKHDMITEGTPTTILPSSKPQFGIPLSFGVGVKFPISKRFHIGTGVNCSLLTNFYEKVNYSSATEYETWTNVTNSIVYAGIPITLSYDIVSNSHVSFYLYTSGQAEKALSNRFSTTTGVNRKASVKGCDLFLSGGAGVGVEWRIIDGFGLYLDPSLNYYFNSPSQPASIRTAQPLTLSINAGIRFAL